MEIPSVPFQIPIVPVDVNLRHQSQKPSELLPQQKTVISTATITRYSRQRQSTHEHRIFRK